jgi:catechol 2,3-dioxygenase-like lactoylglutathione lyase family enzyme
MISRIFHSTQAVEDLEAAREWYRRIFGRRDFRWEDALDLSTLDPSYPTNYSFFGFIGDLPHHFLCPSLHSTGSLQNQTRFEGVKDGMIGIGWYGDNPAATFEKLALLGFRSHRQDGEIIGPDTPPISSFDQNIQVGFTLPDDAGMRHEIASYRPRTGPLAQAVDPRTDPTWIPGRVDPADPLGIIGTSHHTIATNHIDRILRLYVDGFGAAVVGHGMNEELEGASTIVDLAGTRMEFVALSGNTQLRREMGETDRYLSVTFTVADKATAANHLKAEGINVLESFSDQAIAIPAAEGMGVEWRFIESVKENTSAQN